MIPLHEALEQSRTYLASAEARQSIERDPYWPKWNSPWWHMLLLHEMGRAKDIPDVAVAQMVRALNSFYLPDFPFHAKEIPIGKDPLRHILCHCAVGCMYQVLFASGLDVDREVPWMRPWILKYQMVDGGLNCDEAAYLKPVPKSSIMSTVPCLEAILFSRRGALGSEESDFLARGARYLLKQRLFRRCSTGEVIDANWLEVKFPRFYDYDFFRGFYFLAKWSEFSGERLPSELKEEVAALMARQETPKGLRLSRYNLFTKVSYNSDDQGSWSWGEISEFPLLKAVSFDGAICEPLTRQWHEVQPSR